MKEETQLEGIERLTKAAYEATNLISKVAGPYGVPLQVGVSTVYGVVQGLQNYSKRVRNIDFDEFEKRQFFESAVCIMSKFDSDIRKLNNPEDHLRNLERARDQARRVVNVVRSQCEVCEPVLDADSEEEALVQLQSIGATDSDKDYELSEQAYQGRSNLEWIEGQIVKFNEIANFKSGGIGPRQLQALKIEINNFITKTAAPDFLDWYADKAKISRRQLGRVIGHAMAEMRDEVQSEGAEFNTELPESIQNDFNVTRDARGQVTSYELARQTSRNMFLMQAPEISSLYFMTLNQSKLRGFSAAYYSLLGEAYDVWKLSDFNVRVVQEYCDFFRNSLQYNRSIENSCEDAVYIWSGLRTGYQSFYLAALINDSLIMDRLGPFDFRLEVYFDFIQEHKATRLGVLRIAEEGLDLTKVLLADRQRRIVDGRYNPYENDMVEKEWWETTEHFANDFLDDFLSMN